MEQHQPCVLAGVFPGQSPAVVEKAARLAAALGWPLICAYANPARYPVSESADGTVTSAPVDPDFMDDAGASFPAQLADTLAQQLNAVRLNASRSNAAQPDAAALQWRLLLLAGDPAQALARCAAALGADMIVVGTHGDSHTPLRELVHRSVAVQLSRKQHHPVLVVPTHHGRTGQDRL